MIQIPGILEIIQPVPRDNTETIKWKAGLSALVTLIVDIIENQAN